MNKNTPQINKTLAINTSDARLVSESVRRELFTIRDEKHRQFCAKLTPTKLSKRRMRAIA